MVDGADNEGDATKPMGSIAPRPPGEQTIRLDRSIVYRDPSLPSHFGRYQVLSRIGIGGFASVFSARDPELEAMVAIKVLAENHSADVEVRKRFVAEARVARRLGSDRLIGVFDVGETDDGRPFVVMELADRGTLRARVVRIGRPSRPSIHRLIEELGACMTAIHAKGVVHRDIKPSNLLLRSTGRVSGDQPTELVGDDERLLLADFGLARDISGGASALTVGGGTAGYMAPEQADPRGKADHRADIYAATVVVAEMATGRHPERLDLPTSSLPVAAVDALHQALAMDRQLRPATAAIWQELLIAAFRNEAPTNLIRPGSTGDDTGELEPTRIQAPFPHGGSSDDSTLVPPPGLEPDDPRTADLGDNQPPPPPPSIPINPKFQRPPPGRQDGQPARPPADPRRNRQRPAGDRTWPTTPPPGADRRETERPGQAREPSDRGTEPLTPPPPAPPLDIDLGPRPAQPPLAANPRRGAAPPPTNNNSGTRPATPVPAPTPPPTNNHHDSTAPPASKPGPTPIQPPAPTPKPPPPVVGIERHPPPPASSIPVAPAPDPASRVPLSPPHHPLAPGLVATPATVPAVGSTELSERRSKEHLKTAGRLAKLEAKQRRRRARQIRRRRRVLRVANLFIAIIRGALAAVLTSIISTVIVMSKLEQDFQEVSDNPPPGLVVLPIIAFVIGMFIFPWPRKYDYD